MEPQIPGEKVTFRERVLATFQRQKPHPIVWQPRLEEWYGANQRKGTLPERYRKMTFLDLNRDLNCSVRPYGYFNPMLRFWHDEGDLQITVEQRPNEEIVYWKTPKGILRSRNLRTDLSLYTVEHWIKGVDDLPVMEYILRTMHGELDMAVYERGCQEVGDLGEPMIYLARIPIQRLFIEFIGFEQTILMLYDYPREMERFIRIIEEVDDLQYELAKQSPITIINFGDNVHSDMLPPPLFEKWALPYYQRRTEELHQAGKFVYPHWDGSIKPLLPYLKDIDFDGVEALTPLPQGDVTLEEMKAAMGDKILLDGIPAVLFLDDVSYAEVEAFTKKMLEMFAPNLILGISDELSPIGDIEKVRTISGIVDSFGAL